MIRYMLVILCKCTMWCFNKLRKTQWVHGYPVGLEQRHQGVFLFIYFKWEELENFQRSDYHQLRLPVFEYLMNCGEAQTFIHHQSINERKLDVWMWLVFEGKGRWFPAWNCCFGLTRLTRSVTPHHLHLHLHLHSPLLRSVRAFCVFITNCALFDQWHCKCHTLSRNNERGGQSRSSSVWPTLQSVERRKAIM